MTTLKIREGFKLMSAWKACSRVDNGEVLDVQLESSTGTFNPEQYKEVPSGLMVCVRVQSPLKQIIMDAGYVGYIANTIVSAVEKSGYKLVKV